MIVTKLPDVPESIKLLTEVVTPAGKVTVVGCTVLSIVTNVLAPVSVSVPTPSWLIVLYEAPPPANVLADAEVKLIIPGPEVVKLVAVAASQTVPEPDRITLPNEAKLIDLTLLLLVENWVLAVKLKPFRFSVPAVSV